MKINKLISVLLILLVPLSLFSILNISYSKPLGIFTSVVILWFTEIIPLATTALFIPVLAISLGVLNTNEAFSNFGNQVLFLFIGAFLLTQAMQKYSWDKRMAYLFLSTKLTQTSKNVPLAISIICWLLSMWISNTASCAIMTPIALGIIASLKSSFSNETAYKNFSKRLLLTTAFASSIGGMATPVGSPPNVLAIEFLRQKGIFIGFFDWFLIGLPISFFMLIALNALLKFLFPIQTESSETNLHSYFKEELVKLGPLSPSEIKIALCFALAVFLWVFPGLSGLFFSKALESTISKHLPMGVAALYGALPLFILRSASGSPILEKEDIKSIDWGTILLFGGGLTLGSILENSGLAAQFGDILFSRFSANFLLLGFLAITSGILMSEFSSNTASASIIIPILIASIPVTDGLSQITIATAFGASFGFMLPVSTPPNAIVYGTGQLQLKEMSKSGIFFDLLGLFLIWLFLFFIYPTLKVL